MGIQFGYYTLNYKLHLPLHKQKRAPSTWSSAASADGSTAQSAARLRTRRAASGWRT